MTELIPTTTVVGGLDYRETARVLEAMAASRSDSTRRVYTSRWKVWETWCAEHGRTPMPADPAELAAYVTSLADSGRALSTINASIAAIRAVHEDHGFDDPTTGVGVQRVRAGVTRIVGVAPRRQAHPLSLLELQRMLESCDADGVRGTRDRALLLIGFAGALRRSEIAALEVRDVARQRDGIVLTIRRSKGDQEGRGATVGISRGVHAGTDPVTALHAWLDLAGIGRGPLFVAITRHNRVPRTLRAVTGASVDAIIQRRAADAGLGDLPISGHSLRAGHATTAAESGVDASRIARTTRHQRLETLQRYTRPAEALRDTTARDLGL